jgi:hypothetical protein
MCSSVIADHRLPLVSRVRLREQYVHSADETLNGVYQAMATVLDSVVEGKRCSLHPTALERGLISSSALL